MKIFITLFFLYFSTFLYATDYTCANPRYFSTPTFTTNATGNIKIIGNSIVCMNDGGSCGDPGTARNNNINMMYIDIDSNATTFNSSAALLDLEDNATILSAKLYWQGYLENEADAVKDTAGTLKIQTPAMSSYEAIDITDSTYNYNWVYYNSDRYYYQASIDITTLVQTAGEGNYSIADLTTETGQPAGGSYGAWSIVVAYEHEDYPINNLSIFDGYIGLVTGGDNTNAKSYASTQGCADSTGGVDNSVDIALTGFITPKSNTVNSKLIIFAGEGDLGATGDHLYLQKKDGSFASVSNTLNPQNDIFNATISENGVNVTTVYPHYSNNSLGIDIDDFNTSSILDNEQTSTTLRMDTSGDGYHPGVFAMVTELYAPKFCYDYAYKQSNSYFTEENNGSVDPAISGSVIVGDPVEVTLYLRNMETDFPAESPYLSVKNLNVVNETNTIQAELKSTGFLKTDPGELFFKSTTPISTSAGDFNISLATTSIASNQGVYTKFFLDPVNVDTLNIPLLAYFDYSFTVNGVTIDLPPRRLSKDVPLCAVGQTSYVPEWGIFNVLDSSTNTNTDGTLKSNLTYNLFTQVAKRPYDVEIVAFDKTNLNQVKGLQNFISIELIDASGFHDLNASCSDASASASKKVWMAFTDPADMDANITHKRFDKAYIQEAINTGLTDLTTPEEFYEETHENVAFRIWYQEIKDVDNNILNPEFVIDSKGESRVKIDFPAITKKYDCSDPALKVENECKSNDGKGILLTNYRDCMSCIFGSTAKPLCSRDNFASRPESFDIEISDINHAESDPVIQAATRQSTPHTANLAAGYNYRYDINATSHIDNNATKGYTLNFDAANRNDRNISFNWAPLINTLDCNHTEAVSPEFFMGNGSIPNQKNALNDVGRYTLSMIDTSFTTVDKIAPHHTGSHFLTAPDCILNNATVPKVNALGKVGCNIVSQHTNEDFPATLSTSDYNITFHPYRFDFSTFQATLGKAGIALGGNNMLYMHDMNISTASVEDATEMAVHFFGDLRAQGENNSSLPNFTANCYAEDIDLTFGESNVTATNANTPQFQFFTAFDRNATHPDAVTLPPNYNSDISNAWVPTQNAPTQAFNHLVPQALFQKGLSGVIPNLSLHFNFDRNTSLPVDPVTMNFQDINASCSTPANCQFQAELSSNSETNGTMNIDQDVTFWYGRSHAPRYRIEGFTGTFQTYYEVFCTTGNCLGAALGDESVDDVDWYQFPFHNNEAFFGEANTTLTYNNNDDAQVVFNDTNSFDDAGVNTITGTFQNIPDIGFPFKAKVFIPTDPWLVFDRYYNPNLPDANTTSFVIEFFNGNPQWSGNLNNTGTVDSNAAKTTNRRVNW